MEIIYNKCIVFPKMVVRPLLKGLFTQCILVDKVSLSELSPLRLYPGRHYTVPVELGV